MIKIKVEKIVERGRKKYKVKTIEGVIEENKLPHEYIQEGVCCYLSSPNASYIDIYDEKGNSYILKEGELYLENELNKRLDLIRQAGERLHEINKKIKQLEKEWQGEFEIII